MRNLHRQKGLTAIGWILVLVIIIFTFVGGIKIFPLYMQSWKIYSVLNTYETDSQFHGLTPKKLKNGIYEQIHTREQIYDFSKQDLILERGRGVYIVSVDYEARTTLFGNTEVVVTVEKTVEIPSSK